MSISRAIYGNPKLLVFDDSFSAVDTHTESQILGYLDDALGDKTAIIITHRIYSMLEFDKIIVLEDNKIVEAGTHEELVEKGGYYAELFEKQSAGDVVE